MKMYRVILISLLLFLAAGCTLAKQDVGLETTVVSNAVSPSAITPDNIDQIALLQQLGDGVMTKIALSPVDGTVAVGTTVGIYIYDGDTAVPNCLYW